MKTTSFYGLFLFGCLCVAPIAAEAATVYTPYVVTTFAGKAGVVGSVDGTGTTARFASPSDMGVDASNNIYVADTGNNTIRKITPIGVVTTLAGTAGISGSANGTGSAARFNSPIGVAVDAAGTVYVGDSGNNTIRKITPAGVVSTLAGLAGVTGSSDGVGNAARFSGPRGVELDVAGNLYVADTFNNTIRKVTPSGVVSTFAGLAGAVGSTNGVGNVARFNRPRGVAVDSSSNVYVADTGNSIVRGITPGRSVTTIAGSPGVTGSADGSLFAARFFGAIGITVSKSGDIYLADTVNDTVRRITSTGVVSTLAGLPVVAGSANGTGSAARFASPQGVVLNSAGKLFVADTGNNTIRLAVPVAPTPTPRPSPSPSVSPKPSPTPPPGPGPSQPLNISTRVNVGINQNVLIGGFIITGNVPKKVLLRAIGPSLSDANPPVPGALADPVLELHMPDGTVLTNDNWKDSQKAAIELTGAAPKNDKESAMIRVLAPLDPAVAGSGAYTVVVSGKNGGTGVGLVEVYDLAQAADSRLANISTRGSVGTDANVMIGGFILGGGTADAQVVVRALGPSLAQSGISGVLADPTLELRDAYGVLVASNNNWKSVPQQRSAIVEAGLAPKNDLESALVESLPSGNYTAIVAGKDGTTGVALVEIYALQ